MSDEPTKTESCISRWTPAIIATMVVAGFFWTVVYILGWIGRSDGQTARLPREIIALVGTVIGYVSAKADQVVSYYFGSSAGSAAKTDILERVASARANGGAVVGTIELDGLPDSSPESRLLPAPTVEQPTDIGTGAVDDPDRQQ